jgi:hypothetical protein
MSSNFLRRTGLELRRPSRQTVWGFVLAWVFVLAMVLLTVWLARLGA